jgi:outer membrane protein assembly factor BamB
MSADSTTSGSRLWKGIRSIWFPVIVLALFAVLIGVLWWWGARDNDSSLRNAALPFSVVALLAVLVAWLLIGRLPLALRLLGLAAVLLPPMTVAALYQVEDVRFSGGMFPILRPRSWWQPSPDEVLEQHLGDAVNRPVPAGVDLSGKRPTDWAAYRGANRNGIVIGPELLRNWTTTPPRLLWKYPIGGGHAAFAVADKALFTLEQRRDQEAITCYDADTGKQYWAFSYPALFDERLGDKGPRSTPTVIDGEVYALGATGMLTCLDARTGQPKWGPIDMLAGNGNVSWGISGSPLVVDDLIVVGTGVQKPDAPNGTLVALERKTGKVAWSSGKAAIGYSSPMLATLGGKRQILLLDATGLSGYDPAARGKELWRHPWPTFNGINVAQPLVLDKDRVLIAAGYNTGCVMLEVKENQGKWNVKPLWKNKRALRCKFTTPVYYQGHFYGLDNEILTCVNAETGEVVWEGNDYGFGQVLLSKDLLIVQGEQGQLALVEATPQKADELGRVQPWEARTWNVPALADGRLYMRNNREMAAYDLKAP